MNRRLAVSIAACILLLVQFRLGMAVNLGVVLVTETMAIRGPSAVRTHRCLQR